MPLPPPELADRALTADFPDALERLEAFGRQQRERIVGLLPPAWWVDGKRVLDFGCGPGTLLRQLVSDAGGAELHGCDIDAPSIAWLERNLSPPLHVFVNDPSPPLPFPDRHFDAVFAMGALAQIADGWSRWLVELHRVLTDGGLLIATVLGEGMAQVLMPGEPWIEDRVGMYVLNYGATWAREGYGPLVMHSPWWLARHWGRMFEVEMCGEMATDVGVGQHTLVKLHKRPVHLSAEELERPDPADPREPAAMQHQIARLRRDLAALRRR